MVNKNKKADGKQLLTWFRRGFDSHKLSFMTGMPEQEVVRLLALAREDERDQIGATVPSEREQALEND
jgi:hypothetical protein